MSEELTKITYERDIGHCDVSKYVHETTVKTVTDAQNSDNLEILSFVDNGWHVIQKKGATKVGDKVFFIPPETVIPYELSEKLEITKYLAKGKVKSILLRGNRSDGLIVNKDIALPYVPYMYQWEDKPTFGMYGDVEKNVNIPTIDIPVFYKMPNLRNEPDVFKNGDEVFVSEKIHGTNTRFGYLKNPNTGKYQLYVGSHNLIFKNPFIKDDLTIWQRIKQFFNKEKPKEKPKEKHNIYWETIINLFGDGSKLPKDVCFFGEIYGYGIQDLHYDAKKPKIRIFATYAKSQYEPFETTIGRVQELSKIYNNKDITTVPYHSMVFTDIDNMQTLAEKPSELTNSHMREGIVIRNANGDFRMAKLLSYKYLERKNKNRTERH